jgi:hypothetical protein
MFVEQHLNQVPRGRVIMRRTITSFIAAAFFLTGSATFAQLGGVADGVKKAGKATVDTTKDAAEATAKGTKKAADKTKDAVQTTYVCADGKTDQATAKANACKDHGGVKAEPKSKPRY